MPVWGKLHSGYPEIHIFPGVNLFAHFINSASVLIRAGFITQIPRSGFSASPDCFIFDSTCVTGRSTPAVGGCPPRSVCASSTASYDSLLLDSRAREQLYNEFLSHTWRENLSVPIIHKRTPTLLDFPVPVYLSTCEGERVADIPCGTLRSATQTGSDSISYKWKEFKVENCQDQGYLVFGSAFDFSLRMLTFLRDIA